MEHVPILLGVADRVQRRGLQTDILGFSPVAILPFYPIQMTGLVMVLALPLDCKHSFTGCRIRVQEKDNPANAAWTEFRDGGSAASNNVEDIRSFVGHLVAEKPHAVAFNKKEPIRALSVGFGSHVLIPVPFPPLALAKPCYVKVDWVSPNGETTLGELSCGFKNDPPLTDDERRAMLADPSRFRAFLFEINCPKCHDQIKMCESLEQFESISAALPADLVHVSKVPSVWRCKCGNVQLDTQWMKAGLPHMFRSRSGLGGVGHQDHVALYHNQRLSAIAAAFDELIQAGTDEAQVQEFLEQHPVAWAFLSPKKILIKPRILNHFTADFGIVSTNGTLFLVEIEKPSTKLAKRDGGRHNEVQAGLDQIASWREVVEKDRRTLIDQLRLFGPDIHDVRYVAVAGMDSATAARIRKNLPDDTTFLTFKELGSHILVLQSQIARL